MFIRKKDLHGSKPDPPASIQTLLMLLLFVCILGFSLSLSTLKSINESLKHEETNQGLTIPEVPISPYPR